MKDKNEIWYCIFNPTAGRRNYKSVWNEIESKLKDYEIDFDIYFTKSKKDAENFTISKIGEGYRKFISIGGDGTVHEVVNGIMKQNKVPTDEIIMAVIPVGTGNDWAKHHGIVYNMDLLCNSILQNNTEKQDVGLANFSKDGKHRSEYFNNVAGMAYDAFVVEELEKRKSKPNKFIYIFSVLLMLFRYKLQKAKVNIEGNEIRKKFYTINVGICKYSGGGMSLVPHARHNDGKLAVTLAGPLKKLDILLNTYRFYNESLLKHPLIESYQTSKLEVTSMEADPIYLELDGESAGHNPVIFSIVENGLSFISFKCKSKH
ncbi:MAG: diacylglycerol/lipid kinase family protein [Deltaproteobacteria bacterium]